MEISLDRLLGDLASLAEVGSTGDGGNCRLALTDEDAGGRELVVGWMRDLGLEVSVDRIGNVVAVRAGQDPTLAPVMTGSHIDTVRTGGRYDGTLGVLAGLEVCRTLDDAGVTTRRPLAVAFFTDEEGSRFAPDMLGSLVYVGGLGLEDALDVVGIDGARLGDELERIGWAGEAPVPGPVPYAFVELHIEQGPVLEKEGVAIGAVTGVQGISWREIELAGQSNHAGTTPMRDRRDPAYVAAQIVTYVRRLAREYDGLRGTVGRLRLHPDLVNVVPATATLTVDLRHVDDQVLTTAEGELTQFVADTAAREDVRVVAGRSLARFAPIGFDETVIGLVERSARARGLSVRRLPSGAGHDAQMLARVCPTGMIFVPSHDGISHNPAEHTDPGDLAAGANVLLDTLVELAS
ncbi:MAG TPA: Zn-dependent hydrolase [Acidimicrobiales bacterium]